MEVYFIQETVKKDNQYIACIAEKGKKGFKKTGWLWGENKEIAEACAKERNQTAGINEIEALKIVCQSM